MHCLPLTPLTLELDNFIIYHLEWQMAPTGSVVLQV